MRWKKTKTIKGEKQWLTKNVNVANAVRVNAKSVAK